MATTQRGSRLTEQHRKSQVALAGLAAREAARLWPLLDPRRLDETTPGWLEALLRLLLPHRSASARKSYDYYQSLKRAELGKLGLPPDFHAPEPNLTQLRTSMLITGPVKQKQLIAAGADSEQAAKAALVVNLKSVQRHVLNGGRETLDTLVSEDETALGWARVTDANPCYWCAMLASRGHVYKSRETALKANGHDQYHDGCGCTAEPQFHEDAPLPGKAVDWSELWADSTQGHSGKDAINAFRRAYEGRS